MRKLIRHPATWIIVAVAFGVAMYLFQPWRAFTTVEVNEAVPVAAAPSTSVPSTGAPLTSAPPTTAAPATTAPVAGPQVLTSGNFVTHEHETTGKVRVLQLADGKRVLRIEDLNTSDGPDLRVWLSDQKVTKNWFNLDDGKWLELGELKGNKGNANYAIPDSADLEKFKSVTIWCKRFSVSFGAAALA